MRWVERTGGAGDRCSLSGCCLKLVGVEAVVQRREKLSGASVENKSPLQPPCGTLRCFGEVPVQQQCSGGEQGAGMAQYTLPLGHEQLGFYLSSWAEEHGYFGVPEVGKQPQHQPAPKPIEASPLEAFHQLLQGVDEAPGAPDTMELRKKRQRNLACGVPTRSRYQLHYLERVWYAQVKGTTYWQPPLQREGKALLQGLLRRWERARPGNEDAPASSAAPASETRMVPRGPAGTTGGLQKGSVAPLRPSSDRGWWHQGSTMAAPRWVAPRLGCPGQVLRERTRGLRPHRWAQRVLPHGAASHATRSAAGSIPRSPDLQRREEGGRDAGWALGKPRSLPVPAPGAPGEAGEAAPSRLAQPAGDAASGGGLPPRPGLAALAFPCCLQQ